jgi:hypothetical protein
MIATLVPYPSRIVFGQIRKAKKHAPQGNPIVDLKFTD